MSQALNPFDSKFTAKDVILEAITMRATAELSPYLFRGAFGVDLHQRIAHGADMASEHLILELRAILAGEKTEQTDFIEYPSDWWQWVKARFAPRWCLRRWPVKYTRKTFTVTKFVLCPHLPVDHADDHHHLRFVIAQREPVAQPPELLGSSKVRRRMAEESRSERWRKPD